LYFVLTPKILLVEVLQMST